jgi:hypothetical protein
MCTCGHWRERHQHGFDRVTSYCGSCFCPMYRRWYWWRKYRPVLEVATKPR